MEKANKMNLKQELVDFLDAHNGLGCGETIEEYELLVDIYIKHYRSKLVEKKGVYTLFWLHGKSELVEGPDLKTAMHNAALGGGSIKALDFYAAGDRRSEYSWDKISKSWTFSEPEDDE